MFRFISLYPPKSKSLFSFGFLSARYTHYTEEKVMATVATNIGIMDKAYFVGRNEILTWINATLHLHLTRIEEVSWFLSFPLLWFCSNLFWAFVCLGWIACSWICMNFVSNSLEIGCFFEECIIEWKCVGSDFLFVRRGGAGRGSFRCKLIIQCECFWFQGSDTLRVIEGAKMSCKLCVSPAVDFDFFSRVGRKGRPPHNGAFFGGKHRF